MVGLSSRATTILSKAMVRLNTVNRAHRVALVRKIAALAQLWSGEQAVLSLGISLGVGHLVPWEARFWVLSQPTWYLTSKLDESFEHGRGPMLTRLKEREEEAQEKA